MRYVIITAVLLLSACSSEYDLCVEREKEQYRQRNTGASYGQVQSKQAEFEMLCSSYKKK